ncbi:hypothetical protein N7504_004853 [Penicillium tannophilum]|nr:hypothetical protein N7504_004853 [Penicillium tannophilum]
MAPKPWKIALDNVENFFFASSNTHDPERRARQLQKGNDAAKKLEVQHVWYTSFSFGGIESNSKADLMTDELLQKYTSRFLLRPSSNPGGYFTSVHECPYGNAFPVWVGWYPSTSTVYLPFDGPMAFTLRFELGEATA